MTLMRDLVDAALAEVYGHRQTVDASTYLMTDLAAGGLSLSVASAANFSRGLIEVDDELMLADAVDRSSNTITLGSTRARGVRSTTAEAHTVGARVTMAPTVPRSAAVRAVSEVLRSSNGLFAVSSSTFTFQPTRVYVTHDLPETAQAVLDVSWHTEAVGGWTAFRRWRHERYAHQLVVGNEAPGGATVRVTCAVPPTVPAAGEEFTESGLPASCEDVIRFGAAWKLVGFLDQQATLAQSAEASALNRTMYPGTNIKLAQYLYQAYQARLAEEAESLAERYPIRVHYGV